MTDLSITARAGLLGGLIAGALALPALAGTFVAPRGCTAFLTVQQHGCVVSNHYRCDQDQPGDQWRADFNANGPYFVSRIDRETQWVESYDLSTREREVLQAGAADPASFTDLLAKGYDAYDFSTVSDSGKLRHFTGHDRLTGETEVVDGVTLKQTEFEITARAEDGKMLWRSSGHEYVQPELRLFLSGKGDWEDESGTSRFDNTPVRILKPGDTGFGATTPIFDCNTVMSSLRLPGGGEAQ
ncbi:hypothetical protein [Acidimangrovimonas pyrenivorans]|uniref:Uncharacterized protein n=1 Tax=Acidimangrovimonas pyrenivorans TaxID=2030798 RepID=A0ABV7ALN1_9RHOB